MTKRISFADLIRGITEQGWALLTPESELQSIDHKSPILVRSPGGYEQRRPAGAFAPGQLPVSCSYDRLLRKGETMWSVIMGAVERGLSNVGNPALLRNTS